MRRWTWNGCRLPRSWSWRPIARAATVSSAPVRASHSSGSPSSAFQARTPVRTLTRLDVTRRGDYVTFDVRGNAFLHHMVRNIVGCLVYVGKGRHGREWVSQVLAGRDRAQAAPTFEAAGLYLSEVAYAGHWDLPSAPSRAYANA